MSEPVTALQGATDAEGLCTVREIGPIGMISLRGPLSDPAVRAAAKSVAGADLPAQRKIALTPKGGCAWMSSDELLLLCPYNEAPELLAAAQADLAKIHALAVNVSDARAHFEVKGPAVRDVLAKLMPIDLHPDHFGLGDFRRSRLAQVPAALWMPDHETARLICFRSVAQYAFDVLSVASQPGSDVGVFSG
ncbi:MAG: sarcosine oxidase subunit gamma family protein [Pseudomonadota bacterium]